MSLNLFAPESRTAYFPCVRSFTISNAAFFASFAISFASATFANTNTLERFVRISYVAAPTLWKYSLNLRSNDHLSDNPASA